MFDIEEAKRMRLSGLSFYEIGKKLGVSRGTVWWVLIKKQGLPRVGWRTREPSWDVEAAIDMREDGLSYAKIGEIMGVTAQSIRSALKRRMED